MTEKPSSPSRSAEQFVVRLPEGMRDQIAAAAKANNRSMNAEIVKRLGWALALIGEPSTERALPNVSGDIPYSMAQDIAKLANNLGISFDEMLARVFVAGIHKDAPQVLYMPIMPGATVKEVKATVQEASAILRPDATIVSDMISRWSTVFSAPRKGA